MRLRQYKSLPTALKPEDLRVKPVGLRFKPPTKPLGAPAIALKRPTDGPWG